MKNILYGMIALAVISLNSCGPTHIVVESSAPAPEPAPPPPPPAPEVSYQSFYDALSPYGQWINNPEYGYVWMPDVGPDFKPYATNGHWVYTDEGWTWASDYSWGWAAFHYGRWFYEDGYGWMWIPGNEWAPAWVSWRNSPDYYGWAPLGPSVSINVAFGGGYNPPPHYWSFVPHQYVASPQVNNYYVNESRNVTIINNTTVIRNTTIVNNTVNNTTIVNNNVNNRRVTVNNYAGGPDPQEVSRVTGSPVRPIAVRESNQPGAAQFNGGSLAIYRPRVNPAVQQGNGGSQPRFAPPRVQTLNNVRPVNTAVYNNNRGTINNTNVTNNTSNNTNITNNNTNNNTTINNNNSQNTNINNTNNNFNNGRNNPNNATNNPYNNSNNSPRFNQPAQPVTQPNQPVSQPNNQRPVQTTVQQPSQPGNQPVFQRPAQQVNQPNQPVGQPNNQRPGQQVNQPVTQQQGQTGNPRQAPTYTPPTNRPVFNRPVSGNVTPPGSQSTQQKPVTTVTPPVRTAQPARIVAPPRDGNRKDTTRRPRPQ